MNIRFVILLTDFFVYLLVITGICFGLYCMRFEHLRSPWRRLVQNRTALCSAFILSLYLFVGLCDSIHFQRISIDEIGNAASDKKAGPVYSPDVSSLLDVMLSSVRGHSEKTYSSPFAVYSYTKETVIKENGRKERVYKRLIHGGSHLTDSDNRFADISMRLLGCALLFGLAVGALILCLNIIGIGCKGSFLSLPVFIAALSVFTIIACFYLSSYYHIFGTDKVGQDVFFRALKGVRTGMVIGALTTLIMLPFGVIMGVSAGYFKGWVDDTIQYIYITLSSIPGVLLIASAVLLMQVYMDTHPDYFENISIRSDTRLFSLCAILGISSWTGLCRILRGETLKLREMEYVQASLSLGVNHFMILFRHIIPNIMHIVLITVVLDFSGLVLAEAVLSYVGVGVDPSMESWGNMINAARLELARDPVVWWNLAAAFTLMFGLVLSANLFADGVRDAFDPKIRTA